MPTTYPDIRFNASTGSDTAASGAGPSTAITGTAAAHTAGIASTTITLIGTPDLSGVAVDGSAAIYLATASGRKFSKITAVNNTTKTVTVENSFTIALASAVNYAIGGKRATFNDANSRQVFSDAGSYWFVTTETNQSISSVISVTSAGSPFFVCGDSETAHRIITQTANSSCFTSGTSNLHLFNLKFINTNASKSNAGAYSGSGGNGVRFTNCIIGDATNSLSFAASGLVNFTSAFTRCYITTTSNAINTTGTGTSIIIDTCFFNMPAGQTAINYGSTSGIVVQRSIFKGGAIGILTPGSPIEIQYCVFRGQSTAAIVSTGIIFFGKCENVIFDSCGIPLNLSSTQPTKGFFINRNNIFNCLSNTNAPTDAYALTVDPAFTSIAGDNFTVGAALLKSAAFPFNIQNLGISSSTPGYFDLGATQSQASGGSGGVFNPLNHPLIN